MRTQVIDDEMLMVSSISNTNFFVDSEVSLTCNHGFSPITNTAMVKIKCESNGTWTGDYPMTQIQCKSINFQSKSLLKLQRNKLKK